MVRYYLERIAGAGHLNAFLEVYETEALERARELDARISRGETLGPLAGVIVGNKDVICYKDHKVSAASHILAGFTSLYSAEAVERLGGGGVVFMGSGRGCGFAVGSSNENSAYGPV